MKKIITITILLLSSAASGLAQTEGYFGYTAGYGLVKLTATPSGTLEKKAFTNGFTMGGAYYFKKTKDAKPQKLGIGLDVNVQFYKGDPASAMMVGGLMYKGRADKKVQPYVKLMAGLGRIGFKHGFVNGFGLVSNAEYGPAVVAGAGIDIATKNKRLKWRIGADYVYTHIFDRNQQSVRVTTGLVFH